MKLNFVSKKKRQKRVEAEDQIKQIALQENTDNSDIEIENTLSNNESTDAYTSFKYNEYNEKYKKQTVLKRVAELFSKHLLDHFGDDAKNVWIDLKNSNFIEKSLEIPKTEQVIDKYGSIIETYNNCDDFRLKRQLLSTVDNVYDRGTIIKAFDGVTNFKITAAIEHANSLGAGALVERQKITRARINKTKMMI